MFDSLQPHGLWLTRLLCPWDFPGKNTGVGLPFPFPAILPDPGIEPESLVLQVVSVPLNYLGSYLTEELDRMKNIRCYLAFEF